MPQLVALLAAAALAQAAPPPAPSSVAATPVAAAPEPTPAPLPAAYAPSSPAMVGTPPLPAPYRYEERDAEMRSAHNALFVEALGSGGFYSVNFDRMLSENVAFRVGFSYFSFTDRTISPDASTMITAPLTAAWLTGTMNHKLELGGGGTVMVLSGPINNNEIVAKFASSSKGPSVFGSAIIGYRYTPVHPGFFFRVGFTPLFGPGGFLPWGGMSVGGLL